MIRCLFWLAIHCAGITVSAALQNASTDGYSFYVNRRFGSIDDRTTDDDVQIIFKAFDRKQDDEDLLAFNRSKQHVQARFERNLNFSTTGNPFFNVTTTTSFIPFAAASVLNREPRVVNIRAQQHKEEEQQNKHHARNISGSGGGPCRYGDLCLLHCFSDFKDIYGVRDIIDMAVEWINRREDVFPQYRLAVQHMDTSFYRTRNIGESVYKLTKAVTDGIPKALVIGPTFSREATVLAQLAPLYNVMLMSYSAGAADLSDTKLYPYFARTVTSQNRLLPFIYQTFKHFQYSACFIIYERKAYNTQYANEIENAILARNSTDKIAGKESWDSKEDIDVIITKLLSRSIRVLIVSFEGMGSLPGYFFCEARKRGISTRDYFFLIDAAVDSWHFVQDSTEEAAVGCSQTELNEALEGVLQVGVARELPESVSSLYRDDGLRIGISQEELKKLKSTYEAKMASNGSAIGTGIEIGFWQQAYEAIIAGSLAINATIGEFYNNSITDPQTFQSEEFMKELFHTITRVKMVGFTGPLIFEKNGDRVVTFVLDQIRKKTLGEVEHVAYLVAGESNTTWVKRPVFPTPDGEAPAQWEPESKKLSSLLLPYAITGVAFIVLLLALVITFVFQRRLRRKLLKELYSMQWKINSSDLVDNNTNCYAKPLTLTLSTIPNKQSKSMEMTSVEQKKLSKWSCGNASTLSTTTSSSLVPQQHPSKNSTGGEHWRKSLTTAMSILSLAELEARQRAAEEKEAQDAKKISASSATTARSAAMLHHSRTKRRHICKQEAIGGGINQSQSALTLGSGGVGEATKAPFGGRLRKLSSGFHSSDSGGSPPEAEFSELAAGGGKVFRAAKSSTAVFSVGGAKKKSNQMVPTSFSGNYPYRITTYKGSLIHLVGLKRDVSTNISREQLMEIKTAKDIIQQNCCKFIGIILEPQIRALCFEYPSKGALQELLLTETFDLDWDFKVSLLKDVVEGLYYLHTSTANAMKLHGRLSAKYTCLVDDHFVCKLTNGGVPSFTREELTDLDAFMWRSPEFLSSLAQSAASNPLTTASPRTFADSFERINEHAGNINMSVQGNSPAAKAWRRLRAVALNSNTNTNFSSSPNGGQLQQQTEQLTAGQVRLQTIASAAVTANAKNSLLLPSAPNNTAKPATLKMKSISVSTVEIKKSISNNSLTPLSQPEESFATTPTQTKNPRSFRFIMFNTANAAGNNAAASTSGSRSCEGCPSPLAVSGSHEKQFFRSSTETDPYHLERHLTPQAAAWQRAALALTSKKTVSAPRRRRSASTTSTSLSPVASRQVNITLRNDNISPLYNVAKRGKFFSTSTSTTTFDGDYAPPLSSNNGGNLLSVNSASCGGGSGSLNYLYDVNYSKYFTAADDVYALGLIITQVMNRCVPYNVKEQAEKLQIMSRVQNGALADLVPLLTANDQAPSDLVDIAYRCLNKIPEMRPRVPEIREIIHKIIRAQGYASNMMENLLARMDTYAKNLEGLVRERTEAFFEEKKRSEALLHSILPRSVADQLKAGKNVDPESYEAVTIYFSDVVGFTSISAESSPLEVVTMLNELYTLFDNILHQYDAYKVETIGDAYMVVSGLPVRNGSEHARQIALFSLHLLYRIYSFKIPHRATNETLKLRIGIHTGSCCAGVVGFVCPRYCLFGDTVNTASRMESTGEELRIHCSDSCKRALDKFGHFKLSQRGRIAVKGKGEMTTYWLVGDTKPTNANQPSRMRTFECNI